MDWNSYYNSLESWVRTQHVHINSVQKQLHSMLYERERCMRANFLALQKYESEMHRVHSACQTNPQPVNDRIHRSHRYIIPSPWRRMVAECIDAVIVLVVKLMLMYLIKNDSTLVELAKYLGFNFLFGTPEYRTLRRAHGWIKSEFKKEFPLTKIERSLFSPYLGSKDDLIDFEVLLLADQLGRCLYSIIEAILISRSYFSASPGGATFGKWLMNLKVVSCEEITGLEGVVDVFPGTDLGFFRALVRSLLKGASFLSFFSFIFMLLFQYHRCTYDIIVGTLVVQPVPTDLEDNQRNR